MGEAAARPPCTPSAVPSSRRAKRRAASRFQPDPALHPYPADDGRDEQGVAGRDQRRFQTPEPLDRRTGDSGDREQDPERSEPTVRQRRHARPQQPDQPGTAERSHAPPTGSATTQPEREAEQRRERQEEEQAGPR